MPSSFRAHRADLVALAALTALLLPLYLSTMYPDVVASGDTAKFQYLGSVLGTAHPPGYPTYVLISSAWSALPIGTLAWRMNLLSVVAGLLAVLCVFGAARRLGAGVVQAALVAAALGLGRTYWEKLLAAEVYSIGALLVAAAVWRVLAWRDTRLDRDLLAAVALLALGLGNHLTIATVAPAFLIYALAVDARRVLRPRVLAFGALLVGLGVAQYGYILLRTWQGAPHVEASARTLDELWGVMRASRYEGDMFARTWTQLAGEPLTALARLLWSEVGWAGALAIALGVLAGAGRRWREATFLTLSALGVLALTLNVQADTAGFIVPALPLLWLLAALVPGRGDDIPRWRRGAAFGVSLLLAAATAGEVRRNFRLVDHSDRTYERRLWTAVLDAVPDGTRVVSRSYPHDQSLRYILYGEGLSRRDIAIIDPVLPRIDEAFRRDGRTVIAFREAADDLRRSGFEFAPLPLLDSPIPDLVAASRRDRIVIAAVQPEAIPLLATAPDFVRQLGGSWAPSQVAERLAVVGVPRNGRGAPEHRDATRASLRLPVGAEVGPGTRLPVPVEVTAEAGRIRVRVDGREALTTTAALAVVVLGESGQVRQRLIPASLASLRPALNTPVFKLARSVYCEDIGDRAWHDVSTTADRVIRVRVDNYRAYDAIATLYIASPTQLAPVLTQAISPSAPHVSATTVPPDERVSRMAADGLAWTPALMDASFVSRLHIRVNDGGDLATLTFDLGGTPTLMMARGEADRVAGPRVRVCR